jgi:hypothetical protein
MILKRAFQSICLLDGGVLVHGHNCTGFATEISAWIGLTGVSRVWEHLQNAGAGNRGNLEDAGSSPFAVAPHKATLLERDYTSVEIPREAQMLKRYGDPAAIVPARPAKSRRLVHCHSQIALR